MVDWYTRVICSPSFLSCSLRFSYSFLSCMERFKASRASFLLSTIKYYKMKTYECTSWEDESLTECWRATPDSSSEGILKRVHSHQGCRGFRSCSKLDLWFESDGLCASQTAVEEKQPEHSQFKRGVSLQADLGSILCWLLCLLASPFAQNFHSASRHND